MEKSTADPLGNFETVLQPRSGYRFSIDPFLLTGRIHPNCGTEVLDIGCGCGIISLLLAQKYPELKITGVEIQPELAGFAEQNIRESRLENTVKIINADITRIFDKNMISPKDIIVSNPPYKKKGSGRVNPDRQKALARHEISIDARRLIMAAAHLLKNDGLLYLIYPTDRKNDILQSFGEFELYVHNLTFVHSKPDQEALRVIFCAAKFKPPKIITRKFYIYDAHGRFTPEYEALF